MTDLLHHVPAGKVLQNLSHGHTATSDNVAAPSGDQLELAEVKTRFDYLFSSITADPEAHLPDADPAKVAADLEKLGKLMLDPAPVRGDGDPFQRDGNSTIPAVYTYLGQFIDHDITARTDRPNEVGNVTDQPVVPVDPDVVRTEVTNERVPALDLDSVYGDGPTLPGGLETAAKDLYDGIKLKLGTVALEGKPGQEPVIRGVRVPLHADLERDLPRGVGGDPTKANIADSRNDENLIVAQLHLAFLRFHNRTVDWVLENEPHYYTDRAVFDRARQLVTWHYQWLVVHDYLATVALPGVVDDLVLHPDPRFDPRDGEVWMPLEFSVAAFRFGHTMVRGAYDYNRNFGRPTGSAPFFLLFLFTGGGGFAGQTDVLPFNWVIEWERFVEHDPRFPDHFSRKVDTRLAEALGEMVNQTNEEQEADPRIKAILEHLAVRNLLRGYQLSMPTGQAVAAQLSLAPLSESEIQSGNSDELNQHLADSGFLQKTPLWYYVLKEAEVQSQGNALGELGSRIVAGTLIGQLRNDPSSYLNVGFEPWDPEKGVLLPNGRPILTIKDFFRFAGVLPTRP
jgi:hypothetical protein